MIEVTNEKGSILFNSLAEACNILNLKVNTIYAKKLPCDYKGFTFKKIERAHKRDVICTSCGKQKMDVDFYKASKQSEDFYKHPRVNQPCKECISKRRKQKETKFYNPKTRLY